MANIRCSVDECIGNAKALSLCGKHLQRLRRHGDVNIVKSRGGLKSSCLNTEEKFWEKIAKGASDECWPWKLGGDKNGYGQTRWHGSRLPAHCLAFQFINGFRPEVVMHKCDNPPCCNPSHLVAGNPRANAEDRDAKGRGAMGSRVNTSKLSEDQVREIRSRDVNVRGAKAALAREFGITKTSLGLILSGKHWKHIK